MKDSGVEWIGEIPKDWKQVSLMRVLKEPITDGPHETPNYVVDGIPFISIDSLGRGEEIDLSVVKKYISESDYESYNEKTKLTNGDILFTKSATIGKTAIVNTSIKYMIWSPIALIKANVDNVYNRYLYHILNSHKFINHAISLGTSNTQVNVGMRTLEKTRIPLPSNIKVQEQIANFLDQKIAEIDHIIDKTKLSIEEYKKYKQSLITETVTKGLNPDVKMKDSGIEWIGEVPEHWDTTKVKYTTSKIGSGKTPRGGANIYSDDGTMFLRSQNIYNEGLFIKDIVYISEEIDDEMKNTKVLKDDILLNITGGSIGRATIYPYYEQANVNQHVCIIRTKEGIVYNHFLHYILISSVGYNAINIYQSGANREGLNFEQIGNFVIPITNFEEQKEISKFLNKKCNEIDTLASQKQKLLTELESYKKSLIFECVTGKRQVI